MSDIRLAEIRRSLNRGPLTRGEALDLMAEVDNLKDTVDRLRAILKERGIDSRTGSSVDLLDVTEQDDPA